MKLHENWEISHDFERMEKQHEREEAEILAWEEINP